MGAILERQRINNICDKNISVEKQYQIYPVLFITVQPSLYLNNMSKIYTEKCPNAWKSDYFMVVSTSGYRSIQKCAKIPLLQVSWSILADSVRAFTAAMYQSSFLSFSVVIYKQYMGRFSWKSKWQPQTFLWDFMKSQRLFLLWHILRRERKKDDAISAFWKAIDCCFSSRGHCKKGICSWPHLIFLSETPNGNNNLGSDSSRGLIAWTAFCMDMRAQISPQDEVSATICSGTSPSSSAAEYKEGSPIFGPPFPTCFPSFE